MNQARRVRWMVWLGAGCAGCAIAWQVAAKAARDAMFLTAYEPEKLPMMIIGSALISIGVIPLATRTMERLSPGRFVPMVFLACAVATLGVWSLASTAPGVAAVVLYLVVAAFGALLVSGFWSVINESFDPRTGKRWFSTIGLAATVGGLTGGILADRLGAWWTMRDLLLVLALIHVACAILVGAVAYFGEGAHRVLEEKDTTSAPLTLHRRPYLRNIAVLVLLLAIGSGVVDYLFKEAVANTYEGEELLRVFGWFYVGSSLLALVVQSVAVRPMLKYVGLGRMVLSLPATLVLGAAGTLVVPGLGSIIAMRVADESVRNSAHRSSYELLYVPVARTEKRRVKALVDVGFARVGDVVAGILVSVVLAIGVATTSVLSAVVMSLGVAAFLVGRRLERGYVSVLESALCERASELALDHVDDGTTRTALHRTLASIGVEELNSETSRLLLPRRLRQDKVVDAVQALRQGESSTVREVLLGPVEPSLLGHVVPLLGNDGLAPLAVTAIRGGLPGCIGLLADVLYDQSSALVIHRRVADLLGECGHPRAVEPLFHGLETGQFELRYRCGRALRRLRRAECPINKDRVLACVTHEVQRECDVWDPVAAVKSNAPNPLDSVLRARSGRSLEHVFTLLGLALPEGPIRIAWSALNTDDAELRGTALEYLDTVLPSDIRNALWPYLRGRAHVRRQPPEEALAALMKSHESIRINLESRREVVASLGGEIDDDG